MTDFTDLAKRYLVLIEGGPPSNYSAWSPDLPGCVATGDTLEEAEREMRAAIAFHLEGLAEDVASDGSLIVGGRTVTAGDVIHLRDAVSPGGSLPSGP